MNRRPLGILGILVLLSLVLSACAPVSGRAAENGALTASGTISARQVNVASEVGGKVVEVLVEEGDQVAAGDLLFRLDDALLQAQRDQAAAAVDVAQAAGDAARAQYENAQMQYEMARQAARQQEQQGQQGLWQSEVPEEFDLPVWYYERQEEISAAQQDVSEAEDALQSELANLDSALADASNADFVAVETRLAEAQAAFESASQVMERAEQALDNETLTEQAQKQLDGARAELTAAQEAYNRLLTSNARQDILEARARVAVARARRDAALDRLDALRTGEDSLQVEAARTALAQAESAIAQADANLQQAQAALEVLDLQIEKLSITAPRDGVVLARSIEVGEAIAPGSTQMTTGQLDEVELTVYVPEDRYGEVNLGDEVEIRVDSFPRETFTGVVTYISDQAEFTPRNVQTVEGRRATVYAVKLLVPNPDWQLKPGMPADVTFVE